VKRQRQGAAALDAQEAQRRLVAWAAEGASDARWPRETYPQSRSLPELVRRQVERFRGA
jgi:hypothetical protein